MRTWAVQHDRLLVHMGYRTGDAKTGSPRGLIGLLCKRYVHSELHAWAAWLEEGRTPVKAEEGKGQSADVQTFLRRLLRSVARSTRLKSKSIAGTAVSGVLLVACCVLLLHPLPRPLLVPFADSTVFTASVSSTFQKAGPNEQPKLIPRIVHQTFPSRDAVPAELAPVQQSWGVLNPGWQISFWDDALCREFVRKEFPEYFTAFVGLPKNVERADFFRYLVVLRHGGVYADIDAECMQPLDSFIRSADTLVAGWEGEVSDQAAVINRHFARHRQVCLHPTYRYTPRAKTKSPLECWQQCEAHRIEVARGSTSSFSFAGMRCAGAAVVLCGSARPSSAPQGVRPHCSALRRHVLGIHQP